MDETPLWKDMVSNTIVEATGSKEVAMKWTGYDKIHVTVCWLGKQMGVSVNPISYSKDPKEKAKPFTKNLNEHVQW